MASVGVTSDSAGICSYKEKKKWRESVKYLHSRIDRARFWRREGSVLIADMAALRQVMEEEAGQRRQKGTVVGYCSCGAAYPSRVQRGGNRDARRKRQRVNRERLRGERVVSRVLAQLLSSLKGGSDSRNSEAIGRLQKLQQFSAPNVEEKKEDLSSKDKPVYVGVNPHSSRSEESVEKDKPTKRGVSEGNATPEMVNKFKRTIDDGLLLVVSTKVYGREVKTLIDRGATRCFVTPSCVTRVGLKGISQNTFLELGNGQKYLSRGYVPDVPIVTAGLTVKVGLTVTNVLHEVDLVLGMNWLQLVNPVVDWGSGRLYIPNAVHTALLQGD